MVSSISNYSFQYVWFAVCQLCTKVLKKSQGKVYQMSSMFDPMLNTLTVKFYLAPQ